MKQTNLAIASSNPVVGTYECLRLTIYRIEQRVSETVFFSFSSGKLWKQVNCWIHYMKLISAFCNFLKEGYISGPYQL